MWAKFQKYCTRKRIKTSDNCHSSAKYAINGIFQRGCAKCAIDWARRNSVKKKKKETYSSYIKTSRGPNGEIVFTALKDCKLVVESSFRLHDSDIQDLKSHIDLKRKFPKAENP